MTFVNLFPNGKETREVDFIVGRDLEVGCIHLELSLIQPFNDLSESTLVQNCRQPLVLHSKDLSRVYMLPWLLSNLGHYVLQLGKLSCCNLNLRFRSQS